MIQDPNIAALVSAAAERNSGAIAIQYGTTALTYDDLDSQINQFAIALIASGCSKGDRVAVYAHKCVETVVALFGAARAGCIFVPINPLLKPHQVLHILTDCSPRTIITTKTAATCLQQEISQEALPDLTIVLGAETGEGFLALENTISWADFVTQSSTALKSSLGGKEEAAILYTSGSTGYPKGVLLSHANLTVGAASVADYLNNRPDDRILVVLPLSFDAGLNQLITAFYVGARAVLHNYLVPQDVIRSLHQDEITGITGVPSLWIQLMAQDWPSDRKFTLRYFANTGGTIPAPTLKKLRKSFPGALPYLMYGFTEAFRSTYLPPYEIDIRPDSIGKAIPNAEICVVGDDGKPAKPGEKGELVHRGPLVALRYWNNPNATAKKFRSISALWPDARHDEVGAWSGDTVTQDEDGFLYFIGRNDAMIKTSGYRVSPNEIEFAVADTRIVNDCVAIGVPHESLGQAIVLVAVPHEQSLQPTDTLNVELRKLLPGYMLPQHIVWLDTLPLNANGKPDRASLAAKYVDIFKHQTTA